MGAFEYLARVATKCESNSEQAGAEQDKSRRFRSRRMTAAAAGIDVEIGAARRAVAEQEVDR